MIYKYQAYSKDKKLVEGKIDVATEALAEEALYRAGYQSIISLEEATPGLGLKAILDKLATNIKPREIIDASNQMSTLIQAGITISSALKMLLTQITNSTLKKIFARLIDEIQSGKSLSQALSLFPQVFPNTYCQIIRASEQAGTLENGFKQGAKYLDKQNAANQKVKRAMVYPIIILVMAVAVAILLITVALPPLTGLFTSLHADLPWMTTLLINVANFFTADGLYVLLAIVVIVLLFFLAQRNPSVKLMRDKLLLKIPIFGKLTIERSMGLFCQTASMLLQAGLRLPQVLEVTIQTNHNLVIRDALSEVRGRLIQGEGLAQPMSENKLFPSLVVEIVSVGEKTGAMDTSLGNLADFYEREVDRKIDSLIALIEPAMTIVVGLVVLFLATSLITPMYSVLQNVH
jgi:type IV pilus assembly protein PilC